MLKEYREQNNLTKRQMAELLNVDESTYNRYESQKRNTPLHVIIKFLEIRNYEHDKEFIKLLKYATKIK